MSTAYGNPLSFVDPSMAGVAHAMANLEVLKAQNEKVIDNLSSGDLVPTGDAIIFADAVPKIAEDATKQLGQAKERRGMLKPMFLHQRQLDVEEAMPCETTNHSQAEDYRVDGMNQK
jgi:hypothetical protein